MKYDWEAARERARLYCANCNTLLPKNFFGLVDRSRKVIDVYVCSALCEISLSDLIDGCSPEEVNSLLEAVKTMSRHEYEKECRKRGIKL